MGKMAVKYCAAIAVLLGLAVGGATANWELLERFNNAFANYSAETEFVLEELREWNGELIKEFNRELLLEFGRLVPTMRENDAEFLVEIATHEDVLDECRYEVFALRELFLGFQNEDIQRCAYYAWAGVTADSLGRFWPYHNPFARENSRAAYQVIQTLGRRRIFDVEGLEQELEEELEYYQNLREGQTDILWEEIAAHAEAAYKIYMELDYCREWTLGMQAMDHEYIRGYLENDCWSDGFPTLPTEPTEPTTSTAVPEPTEPESTMTPTTGVM